MTRDQQRVVAWAREMRLVHDRLRRAVELAHETPDEGRDLLLHCWGFCQALGGHHDGEDALLFPAVLAAHPGIADTVAQLQQDHAMIGTLLAAFARDVEAGAPAARLRGHLDGLGAVMESHFGFEERALLGVLDSLELDAAVGEVYGGLAG